MLNPYAAQDAIQREAEDTEEAFENWAALAGIDTNVVGAWERYEREVADAEDSRY